MACGLTVPDGRLPAESRQQPLEQQCERAKLKQGEDGDQHRPSRRSAGGPSHGEPDVARGAGLAARAIMRYSMSRVAALTRSRYAAHLPPRNSPAARGFASAAR